MTNTTYSTEDITTATAHALIALAWSEIGDDAEPLDSLGLSFTAEATQRMSAELAAFMEANAEDLKGLQLEQIGHDFILTRNHHGTGFWDRGLGERGDRLTEATYPCGEVHAFVTDSGQELDWE